MFIVPLLLSAMIVQERGAGRIDGNPNFHFVCGVGGKRASITTEDGRLIYRFGRPRQPELTIRQSSAEANVFYRIDWWPSANSQQLRFANGRYSYGVSSWFVAGRHGEEGVGLFVIRDGKVISWRRCRGDDWFSEDNQLGRLPQDQVENVSATLDRPKKH